MIANDLTQPLIVTKDMGIARISQWGGKQREGEKEVLLSLPLLSYPPIPCPSVPSLPYL